MEKTRRQFSLGVFALGLLVYTASFHLATNRWEPLEFVLLFVLGFITEWRAIKLPGYGVLNPGEGFYLAGACLLGPLAGGALAFLNGLVWDLRKGKSSNLVIFNMGWALLTFSLAATAYSVGGLLVATLIYTLISSVLQAYGEHYFSNLPLADTARHQIRETALIRPAVFLVCYFSLVLLELQAVSVLMLILPLELVFMYVKTRELSAELKGTLRTLESTQAELVATGRKAALGVMAAGIAHEINNPLAAAVTNIHMLKMMVHNKAATQSMDLLEKSVDRCQAIVARMLKYSRGADSGGRAVPCEISEILDDAVLFCGRKFEPGGTELTKALGDCPQVVGDPTEIVQIVSNLLANAHDSGGHNILVGYSCEDKFVCLSVEDDGAGIPESLQGQIFEPFFTTKAVGSGTGLGLSIAQGLAKGMGGELGLIESGPGRTVFCLKLPSL